MPVNNSGGGWERRKKIHRYISDHHTLDSRHGKVFGFLLPPPPPPPSPPPSQPPLARNRTGKERGKGSLFLSSSSSFSSFSFFMLGGAYRTQTYWTIEEKSRSESRQPHCAHTIWYMISVNLFVIFPLRKSCAQLGPLSDARSVYARMLSLRSCMNRRRRRDGIGGRVFSLPFSPSPPPPPPSTKKATTRHQKSVSKKTHSFEFLTSFALSTGALRFNVKKLFFKETFTIIA